MSELMTCVKHGDRIHAGHFMITAEYLDKSRVALHGRIEIWQRRLRIEVNQYRLGLEWRRRDARVKSVRQGNKGIVEWQRLEGMLHAMDRRPGGGIAGPMYRRNPAVRRIRARAATCLM
ncbi:MAG: hypothetical protein WB402_11935, partial [Sulfuricaulis sp.]